ncbi:MAG TPA: class I SAM-dependent methyltransferase [Acidimicrobiales bacterium]|nr:class I SAM-dependent methyltransferase [Acidimicrobiales bacterium]
MIYQHPLAYLLGLEGVALLRAFAGEHDRAFVEERFDEIRRLLDERERFGDGTTIEPISATEGYRRWAPSYDQPGNGLIDVEGPIVQAIIDELPVGTALDAACGTGRHTEHLVARGHRVIAVDASPDMLERARARVPGAEYHEADLHELPLPDEHVDLVVCALALAHVPDLDAAFRELARVVKPGGHLVISDAHGLAAGIRPPVILADQDGTPGYLPHTNRLVGDYVRAALASGLRLLRCEEPRTGPSRELEGVELTAEEMLPDGPPNIWLLHYWHPSASIAAFRNQPVALVLHVQRDER